MNKGKNERIFSPAQSLPQAMCNRSVLVYWRRHHCSSECGVPDGGMGWMNGWIVDAWLDEWMMSGCMIGWIYWRRHHCSSECGEPDGRWIDEWMESGWIVGWIYWRRHHYLSECGVPCVMKGRMDRFDGVWGDWLDGLKDEEWVDDWMGGWLDGWMIGWVYWRQ